MLNQFQHFIAKRILHLKTLTRSDMCESLLGLHPIMACVDRRKLYFFQKLCNLDGKYLSKRIFLLRLFSFYYDTERKHLGFIPDIIKLLYQYDLHTYLLDFILENEFPSKETWKRIVDNSITKVQSDDWKARVITDDDFQRFRNIHKDVVLAKF